MAKCMDELCSEPCGVWILTTGEKVGEVDREKERRRYGRKTEGGGKAPNGYVLRGSS